ncbi:hypothetical protein [Pollutimonas bauzanensis]|uniref:Uncharacterized protein n=1 Tax=Pollutimonas bauzanensis TaxID=658167 RepID=A0A1M5Q4L7_9BURK|nr:hypothetical protein [Pollutimonas bauzanensis]SHH08952.1 hypothetical protein SAMN04488135_102154 [Pollutimonas bauzanensis]
MSSSIQSISSATLPSISQNSKKAPTSRFTIPEIRPQQQNGAESTVVNISTKSQQNSTSVALQNGSFSPEMMAHMKGNDNLGKYLKDVVYNDDASDALVDLTDYMNGGPIRYTKTGEPVTAESEAYFNKTGQLYRSQKIALYETEMKKGTALDEIYQKLADLTAQQPERFLGMKGYIG